MSRRGMTPEDRAERRGVGYGFEFAFNICLLAMSDLGMDEDLIFRVYSLLKTRAKMSIEGRLKLEDVKKTLKDEYGFCFSWIEDVKGIKKIETPERKLTVEVPEKPDINQLLEKFKNI